MAGPRLTSGHVAAFASFDLRLLAPFVVLVDAGLRFRVAVDRFLGFARLHAAVRFDPRAAGVSASARAVTTLTAAGHRALPAGRDILDGARRAQLAVEGS